MRKGTKSSIKVKNTSLDIASEIHRVSGIDIGCLCRRNKIILPSLKRGAKRRNTFKAT